ncbi:MAG: hypothetical protein V3R23_02155 [Nitrospinaceae bacterium]
MKTRSLRDQWSFRLTFFLAATGSAVGLEKWKFPLFAGKLGCWERRAGFVGSIFFL